MLASLAARSTAAAPRQPRPLHAACRHGPLPLALASALLLRPAAAQLPYGVTVYPAQSFGFGLPGNSSFPIDAAGLNAANPTALQQSSAYQCNYMEKQFTEQFNVPTLNLTKWLPTGSVPIPVGQKPTSYGSSNYPTPWGPAQFGAYQSACARVADIASRL